MQSLQNRVLLCAVVASPKELQNRLQIENIQYMVKDLTIFMSCTGLVCQLTDHQKSACPVFNEGKMLIVPFKVKEKSLSPI